MKTWMQRVACAVLFGMGLVAQARTVHLYYTDPQGTVLAKTDAQGNILARYDYRPYGGVVSGSGPDGPGYTGHVQDPETGLIYMQQRYDDPLGRFPSPDPMGPVPGNLFSFNRYDYADNNPIVNADPTGACVGSHDGQDAPCNPPRDQPSSQPRQQQPSPPPPPPKTVTTLATVSVTATATTESIAWSEIGEGLLGTVRGISVGVSAPGAIIIGALLPTTMGAAPCEMPGHSPCGMMMSGAFPPGFWPGDSGAAEWGKKHGLGSKEGKDRFHRGVKEHTPGARGDHDFGVNPETGEVVDQNGEPVGNLNDEQ